MAYQHFLEIQEDQAFFSLMREYESLLELGSLNEKQMIRLKEIENIIYDEA